MPFNEDNDISFEGLPRLTWIALPDLTPLTGSTIFEGVSRRFFQYTPATILKLGGNNDGEDIMTALANSVLGEYAPRVESVVTLLQTPSDGRAPFPPQQGLILTRKPGVPLSELWPSLSTSQRAAIKSALCDILLRMRARRFAYYGRSGRQPYVLSNFFGPVIHEHCRSRAEWDASRIRALHAATLPAERAYDPLPADRVPALERVQRETTGTDGWDRPVLTHGDLSDRNIIVDPDTLAITGLIDWEMANVMPAYYEYVDARLSDGHLPEWRHELLDVLRAVLRHECAESRGGESGGGAGEGDGGYRKTLEAWDAIVDVERFAQRIGDDCYGTFDTGLPDS